MSYPVLVRDAVDAPQLVRAPGGYDDIVQIALAVLFFILAKCLAAQKHNS